MLVTLSQDHWRLVHSEKKLTEENSALRRRANTFDDEALGFQEAENELVDRLNQQQAAYAVLEADHAAVKEQLLASKQMNDLLTLQIGADDLVNLQMGAVTFLAEVEEENHLEELAAVIHLAQLEEESLQQENLKEMRICNILKRLHIVGWNQIFAQPSSLCVERTTVLAAKPSPTCRTPSTSG